MIGTCLGMIFLSTPSARRATVASVTGKHRVLFLSTPSARRATYADPLARRQPRNFYPRPPRGGRLHTSLQFRPLLVISIPARRAEGDEVVYSRGEIVKAFLSTPSAGRATVPTRPRTPMKKFLSTPSAGRATGRNFQRIRFDEISIHALRGEGDVAVIFPPLSNSVFLSTPSAGRATFRRCTI